MGRVSSIKIERCVVVINAAARVGKVVPGKGLGGEGVGRGNLGARWGHFGSRVAARIMTERAHCVCCHGPIYLINC